MDLFPLHTTIVPGEKVPLHIFEDRYKKMVKASLKTKKPFGIVQKTKGRICNIGCSVKIQNLVNAYDNGEYDIIVEGVSRFKIASKKNYLGLWMAKVEYLDDISFQADPSIIKRVHDKYLKTLLANKITQNFEFEIKKKVSYDFCKSIHMDNNFKQPFLELENENERLLFLGDLFDQSLEANMIISNNVSKKQLD